MKKQIAWMLILSMLLFLGACSTGTEEITHTEFLVACFGCKQEFPGGQLNADFGLCQDCMIKVGAAYCQNCSTPCYTRDMIQGLCPACYEAVQETKTVPEATLEPENMPEPEATHKPNKVHCEYCGYSVRSDYMIGDYCAGCYCIRVGKCLRCTYNSRAEVGCHCEYCSSNWFYCASCDKRTDGKEMFLDLCMDCYWRINSVLVPCPLCGASYAPSEIKGGYCPSCYVQATYHEYSYCSSCGDRFESMTELYDGLCCSCYAEQNYCITCNKRPSDGLGAFGRECEECYYAVYIITCPGCGYDYSNDDIINGYCDSCFRDGVPGTYYADYENIKITITFNAYADYCLTYTDLSSGITLKNIPLSYYNANTSTEKLLMFHIDESYPEYSGYVEFCMYIGARASYSYNALIDGLEDTDGFYASLTRE